MRKVLFFHHYNSAIGAGLCLIHIVEALSRNNDITVVLPKGGDLAGFLKTKGATIIETEHTPCAYMHYNGSPTGFLSIRHLQNLHKIRKDQQIVERIIKEKQPDIVAINSMTLFWIGKVAKKLKLNIKTVCFHRETYKKGLFGFRSAIMKHELIRYFDGIAYISNYDKEATGKSGKVAVRITDKVDFNLYSKKVPKEQLRVELGLPKDKRIVLYTGGCNKLKGGLTAVSAMEHVLHQDVVLVFLQYTKQTRSMSMLHRLKNGVKIIANKDYQHLVDKEVTKKQLEERVIFLPGTNHVEKYFLACDAVVFPSHLAHQARPIYEAGAAQIPIFISDFPNTREFVTEENGYLVEPDNAIDLAKRIDEWIDDSESAELRLKSNYDKSITNHNLNRLAFEVEQFLSMI